MSRLFAGGGGAKSRLWLQIQADVLGRPIHVPRDQEACALGSALVAAVHSGHYADLAEAAANMVQIGEVIEPQSANKATYDYYYGAYVATYPALRPLMHRMVDRVAAPGEPRAGRSSTPKA